MAMSGSLSGSWSGSGSARLTLRLDWQILSQSIANNTSRVKFSLVATRTTTSQNTYKLPAPWSMTINGTSYSGSNNFDIRNVPANTDYVFVTQTVTISHNTDGTKSFSASATIDLSGTSAGTGSVSGTVTLETIPRYATANQQLASKTETSITMNWSSDNIVDYIWYSSDNGTSWTGINVTDGDSGSYTISGLSANTEYKIKTRVRRKDSQLTTDSSTLSVTTYDYPYCKTMPNFKIGDKLKLEFYNPLGRSITFYIIANGTEIANNWTITGTAYEGVNAASSVNQLYATIPNDQSATYNVRVVYGSSNITKTGGTFSVDPTVCSPAIGSADYVDTDSNIIAITGNNKKIVRNQSIVNYSATGLEAKKSATVASVSVAVNGLTYNLTVSGTSASGGNAKINSGSNVNAVFTITDSRGLTATETVNVTMIDWQLPTAIITLARQNNFYSLTYITVDADYSYVEGNNTISISYKARKNGTSSWTITGTLQDNVQDSFTADNEFKWDVQVVLTDRFGGTTTYNLSLSRGMPIIYFDRLKSSVGINCFPANDGSLEVNGYDLTVHDNDTITLSGTSTTAMIASGVLTNSGTRVLFSVVLPRFVNGLTVTVDAMGLNIWHSDGGYVLTSSYVGSGGYDVLADSSITVTATLNSGNVVTFCLEKTTAFNGTNNTPVAVQVNNLQLSFS